MFSELNHSVVGHRLLDKCWYGWASVVGMQSGSKCEESLEIRPSCGTNTGLSGKFLGYKINKFQWSYFLSEAIVYAVLGL